MLSIQFGHIRYFLILTLIVTGASLNSGCNYEESSIPSSSLTPGPVVYTGNTELARITIDNAGYLLSRLFNSISSGHQVGRVKVLSTELEELPLMSTEFLTSVIDSVNNGNTTPNVCDSGRYTIDYISGNNISIVGMKCQLNLMYLVYDNYRPTTFGSPSISVIISNNSTNHVEASMEFNYLFYYQAWVPNIEENIDLELTGSIAYSNTLLNNAREIYTGLNIVGEYDTGRMMKFSNFGIVELIDDVNDPENGGAIYFSGSPAMFYDSVYGGVRVETISPLRFSGLHNSTANTYPDESGEILISGDNSSMRFIVMSGRHFKLEIDIDGDGNPDAIRYIEYQAFRPDYAWAYKCPGNGFSCDYYNLSDFDGDGMHDYWELIYDTNPNVDDALFDYDNDGLTNFEEYTQGYMPNNEYSRD